MSEKSVSRRREMHTPELCSPEGLLGSDVLQDPEWAHKQVSGSAKSLGWLIKGKLKDIVYLQRQDAERWPAAMTSRGLETA
jgi:hypothetical protein